MDVTVGMTHVQHDLTIDVDQSAEEVEAKVSEAMATGSTLRLVDERERVLLVPADKIAFVLVGAKEQRRVGFSL